MLNSTFLNRQAGLFAERLRRDAGSAPHAQVAQALCLATGRTPLDAEVRRGTTLIDALAAQSGLGERAALDAFCLVVLNMNEFIYLD
jgi:hypothetical protein